MKHLISQLASALLLTLLAACNLPQASAVVPVSEGPKTWFDAPLDGSNLPLAPYPVMIHAYDPGGVSQVEFSVNGEVLGNLKPTSTSGLAIVEYSWQPQSTGNFVLRARAQGQAQSWNSEASVTVTIGDFTPTTVVSFTPTPVDTFTPTSVISFTPTNVDTFTPTNVPSFTPTPVPAGLSFKPNISTSQIYAGDCGTNQVTIQAYVTNPSLVSGITLFLKLKNQTTGESTSWSEGDTMDPAGNGWYQRTVSSTSIPGYNDYKKSWILYQFVATNGGSIVGRSPVYSDIGLSLCSAPAQGITPIRIAPPVQGITPVRIAPVKTPTLPLLIVPPLRRAPTKISIPILK
jgi:hypothetical protein